MIIDLGDIAQQELDDAKGKAPANGAASKSAVSRILEEVAARDGDALERLAKR